MTTVFIDGSEGTTGLQIQNRLKNRDDITLITLTNELLKNSNARAEAINKSDVSFLCLPDDAAAQAASFVNNNKTIIIDTSAAHRVSENWTYGLPELTSARKKIASSNRIANPGCHASGFIALVAPLVETGILNADINLSCISLTGYSGGGKKMIVQYNKALTCASADTDKPYTTTIHELSMPRAYALNQNHKHLPEIKKYSGLKNSPVFCPIVNNFYSGMQVIVPIDLHQTNANITEIQSCYKNYYNTDDNAKYGMIYYADPNIFDDFVSCISVVQTDQMIITATGNDKRITLMAMFDNLGKGASGAAIQNMNIALGLNEKTGLICIDKSKTFSKVNGENND